MVMLMPFGMYKGRPLVDVPTSYLRWLLRECKLSSGLGAAVAAEAERRGLAVPPVPPERVPRCLRCGPAAGIDYLWSEDSRGRRIIRRECRRCHGSLGIAAQSAANLAAADANANPTALLDTLTAAEAEGVTLMNHGNAVDFASGDDWKRASQGLRQSLRQVRHRLAGMLPKGRT